MHYLIKHQYLWLLAMLCFTSQLHSQEYCIPSIQSTDDGIYGFSIKNYFNTETDVPDDGYTFYPYSDTGIALSIGESYYYAATSNFFLFDPSYLFYIDYNKDFEFDSTEKISPPNNNSQGFNGYFSLPNDSAILGLTRLRVVAGDVSGENLGPCGDYADGDIVEYEDYEINIVSTPETAPPYCIPLSPNNYNRINDFTLNDELYHLGSGYSCYGYYTDYTASLKMGQAIPISATASSVSGYDVWIDFDDNGLFSNAELLYHSINTSFLQSFIHIPINEDYAGEHRLRIRHAADTSHPCEAAEGETQDYLITILPFVPDYCMPYCQDIAYDIGYVSLNDFTYESDFSGCYELIPLSVTNTNLNLGCSYPFALGIDGSTGNLANFAVWMDFNTDTLFSNNELLLTGYQITSINEIITIPNDPSITGTKRMRVRMSIGGGIPEPCNILDFTKVEDFMITISDGECVTGIPSNDINYTTNPRIEIYPNPSQNFIHINSKLTLAGKPYAIYNINGQKVLTGTYQASINITDLPLGLYFLQIGQKQMGKQVLSRLFIRK